MVLPSVFEGLNPSAYLYESTYVQDEKKGRKEGERKGKKEGLQEALKKMIASGISEDEAVRILGGFVDDWSRER